MNAERRADAPRGAAERRADVLEGAAEGAGGGGGAGAAREAGGGGDAEQEARIISRGYRSYDGPRTSLWGSVLSIVVHSTRYTLGMGRAFRYKLLPWFAIMVAVLPAVVFVALAAAPQHDLNGTDALPGYHLYYGLPVSVALVFFCGLSVPDILVPDRRNGMLPLYMSTRLKGLRGYLASKALAAALLSSILTVLPILILVLSHVIEGEGPAGPGDWAVLAARIAAAGFVCAAAVVALSMAVSSLTDRRGFASTGVFLLTAGGSIFATLLATGGLGARGYAFSVLIMTVEAVDRIYAAGPELVPLSGTVSVDTSIGVQTPPVGSPGDARLNAQATGDVASLETWFVALSYAAWTALGVLGVCLRYWRRGAGV